MTQVAGRGVGMDVVRSEIAGLGGRVEAAPGEHGRGTTFSIYLPLTLAVAQAVLVRAGEKHLCPAIGDGGAGEGIQSSRAGGDSAERRDRVAEQPLSAVLSAAASGRPGAGAGDASLRHDAAAQERQPARRGASGRDSRQPGNRGQEHRPAACPRARYCRGDGAGQRPGRADYQSGAAGAAHGHADSRRQRGGTRGADSGKPSRRPSWWSTIP